MNKSRPTRIIGVDYGMKRIGIAYSDELKIIASPMMTLETEKKLEHTIQKLLQAVENHQQLHTYKVEKAIVGLPLMMSGKTGFIADEVKHFVAQLEKSAPFPIVTWDERLTSVQAERTLRDAALSRKKRAKVVDKVSAVIILQSYLDNLGLRR